IIPRGEYGHSGGGQSGPLTQVEGQSKQPFLGVSPLCITILIYGLCFHARSTRTAESISPSRSRSHAIFAIATFTRPFLYGVSRQHKLTKVIPKTTQVMQFPVGKKSSPRATQPPCTSTVAPPQPAGLVLFPIIRLNTLRPVRPSRRKLPERGGARRGPGRAELGLPDGTHVPSVIVQKRFRFGEAAR
ncbi:hypothetical protein ALC60_04700, partial [Trachymyrmex zeteki]